jgi:hypothetical protein
MTSSSTSELIALKYVAVRLAGKVAHIGCDKRHPGSRRHSGRSLFLPTCISYCGIAAPLRNRTPAVPGPCAWQRFAIPGSRELCFSSFTVKGRRASLSNGAIRQSTCRGLSIQLRRRVQVEIDSCVRMRA